MSLPSPTCVWCTGNICNDIPVWPVDRFEWGTTVWVDRVEENIGGNGGSTAFTMGKLGTPVRLFGMVGQDARGDALLSLLNNAGVNTDGVRRAQAPTNCTVAVVNSSGDRLFLHRVGASAEVDPDHIDFTSADPGSHFHLANLFALPQVRGRAGNLLQRAKAAGLTTSLDTGWDASGQWMELVGPALPHTDLLFINESESRMLTGLDDPRAAAARLMEQGATRIFSKRGPEGCMVYSREGALHVPGFPVKVIDTTGAGDCFAGALLSGLYRGMDLKAAVRFANAVGALSVTNLGATGGVLSYNETLDWMKSQ